MGNDVVLSSRQCSPLNGQGTKLLAHELVHVVQQQGLGSPAVIQRQTTPPPSRDKPEPPPYGITIDLLDPLNSSIRLGGFGVPSPRTILEGLEKLRGLGRGAPSSGLPPMSWPQLELTDEDVRRITCRTLPSLCVPALQLRPLTLQPPRLVYYDHRIVDHFIFDNAAIPDRHRLLLDRTATEMIDHPAVITDIVGHTDTRGRATYNQGLSERRAGAVQQHLLTGQVPTTQIWNVVGRGERTPRFPNDATDDLAASRNRRVELMMRRLSWPGSVDPRLQFRLPQQGVLGITDPRERILQQDRARFTALRDFVVEARRGIEQLLNAPPAGHTWVRRDNENITQMLSRVDALIADLRAERLILRFDLPVQGKVAAKYDLLEGKIRLRPIRNDVQMAQAAASLVHEYAHHVQDVVAEELQRAARQPTEHTREDELRQETESRRHGVYFTRFLGLLGHSVGFHVELTARVFLGLFEKERTGSPTEQATARREIRSQLGMEYASQIAANAPMRRFLIEIRSDRHAILLEVGGRVTDLGAVPASITTRDQLNQHLNTLVDALPTRARLFGDIGGKRVSLAMFVVYDGNRKIGEFGLRR